MPILSEFTPLLKSFPPFRQFMYNVFIKLHVGPAARFFLFFHFSRCLGFANNAVPVIVSVW
jgi:hypothetical protein